MADKTVVYPYCYKIKESCPPCDSKLNASTVVSTNECVKLLAKYMADKSNKFAPEHVTDQSHQNVGNCLKQYGDIYKKLGIELYVNPRSKQIAFPTQERIASNYNLFLRNIGVTDPATPKEDNGRDEKISMYQLLLNEPLREVYNSFYQSSGFSELDSILPKEYGIAKLMGPNASGGKRDQKRAHNKKQRTNKRKKTKHRRMTRSHKHPFNIKCNNRRLR